MGPVEKRHMPHNKFSGNLKGKSIFYGYVFLELELICLVELRPSGLFFHSTRVILVQITIK